MTNWTCTFKKNFTCDKPIFIEGLPGIGNVGKVVIDYLIDNFDAKKVASISGFDLPNSVFVNSKGLVQLPSIDLFYVRIKKTDFLFLTGDAQPANERASYELTELILDFLKDFDVQEIITLGGIGLDAIPEKPELFLTGNKKSFIKTFSKLGANNKIFGVVGPIIGVSGLLLGMSNKIPSVAILCETFAHPLYIGLSEARLVLELLKKRYSLKIDFKDLDDEIKQVNDEIESSTESKPAVKNRKYGVGGLAKDMNYIG